MLMLSYYANNFEFGKSWLSKYFNGLSFGNRILWFIGISFVGWILSKLVIFIWGKWILPITTKTESSLDDHLGKNLHKPFVRLLTLGSVFLAAHITITSANEVKIYVKTVENILYLFLILFLASLVNSIIKGFTDWYLQDIAPKTESTLDNTLFPVLRKVGTVIIYFIAATIILAQFKVDLTGLVATAGVASLAIAFGAQAALADLIAGVSIILDRSFHVGDRIELKDGVMGDVIEIGLRSTRILSLEQRLIIVPNREVAGSRITNWSQPNLATNVKLKIGVAMEEDLERVKQIILSVCANEETVSKRTQATVICTGFGPYYIELLIVATVDDCHNTGKAVDQLVIKIQDAFKKEKIKLPLPLQHIQVQQVS
jgi:MscS family membrane protein